MEGVEKMRRNIKRISIILILAYVVLTRVVTPSYMAFAFRGPVSNLEEQYTCNWNLVSPEDVTEENLQFLLDTGVCQKIGDVAEQPLVGDDDDDDGAGEPDDNDSNKHDKDGPSGPDGPNGPDGPWRRRRRRRR